MNYNAMDRTSNMARKLASDIATTNPVVLYEVPTGMSARILSLWISNNHNNAVQLRVFHTRSSESASTSNALLYDTSIAANITTVYDAPILMSPGDKIWIRAASATYVCVTLYGEEA
jgi:hypothetical protein